MEVLVTGSSGHLGEALVRTLRGQGHQVRGLDTQAGAFTTHVGSVADAGLVRRSVANVSAIFHTATLHKPHIGTHSKRDFVETNVTGTLLLLEAALAAEVAAFVFTSTTSTFGDALRPRPGEPAVWVTEAIAPKPRNIYGVSKTAAEDLCQLFHRLHGLNVMILRTSRFFPEADDDAAQRAAFADRNVKANEFLHRRVDIEDVVSAHLLAAEQAADLGFGRYLISATTPFRRADLVDLNRDAAAVVAKRVPGYAAAYERAGWRMFAQIGRVYDNAAARRDLGWRPRYDFAHVVRCLNADEDFFSPLAGVVGSKGYHDEVFPDGPYPVA